MYAATLSLVLLEQQILLPDVFNCRWREDIMTTGRQEWHRLQFVLEFDAVFGRSNLLLVLVVLTVDHLLNPANNAQQVAS